MTSPRTAAGTSFPTSRGRGTGLAEPQAPGCKTQPSERALLFPGRGRRAGFAGLQAPGCETQSFWVPSKPALQAWSRGTQPPRGAGSDTQCATVGAKAQSGAAILAAMLTVTLVASFAAAALWQQWRSVEVESAERARVQSAWILTGALDWSRLILREDAKAGGADYLAEPWAVPLNEARLSSFLSIDKNATDTEREAFLSGQVSDLQGRLNVANLIQGRSISVPGLASFSRLFDSLGLPREELNALSSNLLEASKSVALAPGGSSAGGTPPAADTPGGTAPASSGRTPTPSGSGGQNVVEGPTALTPLMPQRIEQLAWLGLSRGTLATLTPYITLLPEPTKVNLNTASAQVIFASTPNIDLGSAAGLVAARERRHFSTLQEANNQVGREGAFGEAHAVASNFFEVRGRLRLDQTAVEERSVLRRDGNRVTTVWRERGVITEGLQTVPYGQNGTATPSRP
jgi:general secretion pathway protein K